MSQLQLNFNRSQNGFERSQKLIQSWLKLSQSQAILQDVKSCSNRSEKKTLTSIERSFNRDQLDALTSVEHKSSCAHSVVNSNRGYSEIWSRSKDLLTAVKIPSRSNEFHRSENDMCNRDYNRFERGQK